jgi:hypothetical protein
MTPDFEQSPRYERLREMMTRWKSALAGLEGAQWRYARTPIARSREDMDAAYEAAQQALLGVHVELERLAKEREEVAGL